MWVNRDKYSDNLEERYQEGLEKGFKTGYESGINIGKDLEREAMTPFPAYYQERLEYWKGRFDKGPTKHKLKVTTVAGEYCKEFDDLASMEDQERFLEAEIEKGSKEFLVYPDIVLIDKIVSYTTERGHPDPYAPEEIESWAKEKVKEEMKGWRVMKSTVFTVGDPMQGGIRIGFSTTGTYENMGINPICSHVPNALYKALYLK
ncbi:MAG: hypothetical protein ABIH23_10525 [bacterium]